MDRPAPRYPLLVIAAGGLAFFALAEFLAGWWVYGFGARGVLPGFLEHWGHISSSLGLAAACLLSRRWLIATPVEARPELVRRFVR